MTRSFWLVISLVFGLSLVGLVAHRGELVTLAIPLLAYLAMAIWRSPDQLALTVKRRLSTDKATQGTVVEARVSLTSQGTMVEEFHLVDHPPGGILLQDGVLSHAGPLPPGGGVELEYRLTAGRGRYIFDSLHAVGNDPFGLFFVEKTLSEAVTLLVYPKIADLSSIPIRPPNTKGFTGPIPSRKSGTGMDFFGVRDYQQGDSLRRINWRMSARHVQDLFTNEFEQERIADVGLILDARQQYNYISGHRQIFESSVMATASLADVFLEDGHAVSLVTFGAGIARVFPGYGKVQRERILRALANARTGYNFALDNLGNLPARLLAPRTQLVYISSLSPEDIRPLLRFRAQGYDVLIISPDPLRFELAGETGASTPDWLLAARFARLERDLLIKQLVRSAIRVIDWDVDQPLSQAIEGVQLQLPLRYRSIRVLV